MMAKVSSQSIKKLLTFALLFKAKSLFTNIYHNHNHNHFILQSKGATLAFLPIHFLGLSAAFTIAHELGHIFNIPHDDERKCAEFMPLNKANYHIMAPTLEYNTNPWSWSACSSAMLIRFLDNRGAQTQCILDQPVERRYYEKMFETPAPGAM
jgi:hypothetical protein